MAAPVPPRWHAHRTPVAASRRGPRSGLLNLAALVAVLAPTACGGADRGRADADTDVQRLGPCPPGYDPTTGPFRCDPDVVDRGSGPYRCDQEAGYEPVPVYDPDFEPTLTDYADWPEPPDGCDDPDDDEPCVCDAAAPPPECFGVVTKPEYIEDFETGASNGAWYINNEVCELCQKYIDLRVGPFDTAGSTQRTLLVLADLLAVPDDEGLVEDLRVELAQLERYLDYLADRYLDQGLYTEFVRWRDRMAELQASELTEEDWAPLTEEFEAIEARLYEATAACHDECAATEWPTPVWTKPLPASRIPDGGRCGSRYALNVKTVPLIKWGGTIGLRFGPPLDGSDWDGIAFWARVGAGDGSPDRRVDMSRTPVRVEVSDRHTDEKFDEGEGPYCDPLHTDDNTEVGCDKFGIAIQLGPDWQFYTLAFDELRQKGWGKQAPYFDVWGIRSMAFQFERGTWDLWIDDVRLYRRAEP
jgi:hypothetical protein